MTGRNPFKPASGATPPLLVGRADAIEEFKDSLADGPGAPGRLTIFTGARGVGKTVMLTEVANEALKNGWVAIAETATPGYDDLRAELSYTWKAAKPAVGDLSEVSIGINGSNLLNRDIRNSVSYSKNAVLMPGASVRLFTTVRY